MGVLHHREVTAGALTIDVLEPEGAFTAASSLLADFDRCVKGLLSRGHTHVCVSCRLITDVDSSGIGCLVGAYSDVKRHAGRFGLKFGGNDAVSRLVKLLPWHIDDDDPDSWAAGAAAPLLPPPGGGSRSDARKPEREDQNERS